MAAFVLVHGAWHGGWCWKKVIPLLRAAGHDVWTPTLTGVGERAHLLSPTIDLTTHTQDVLGVLAYEDLRDVILVGHSYGGMVITTVAEQAPERLTHLVYLDAFIPRHGLTFLDLFPIKAQEETLARARDQGDGWRSPPNDMDANEPFGVSDPADAAWLRSRLSAHPVGTWTQSVELTNPAASALSRTFINCTATNWFAQYARHAQTQPGWRYRELATVHDAMVTMPQELVDLLIEVA